MQCSVSIQLVYHSLLAGCAALYPKVVHVWKRFVRALIPIMAAPEAVCQVTTGLFSSHVNPCNVSNVRYFVNGPS